MLEDSESIDPYEDELTDLGGGVYYTLFADGEGSDTFTGIFMEHRVDDDVCCRGTITFDVEENKELPHPKWKVKSVDPLTLSPSIDNKDCPEKLHGWIEDGKWTTSTTLPCGVTGNTLASGAGILGSNPSEAANGIEIVPGQIKILSIIRRDAGPVIIYDFDCRAKYYEFFSLENELYFYAKPGRTLHYDTECSTPTLVTLPVDTEDYDTYLDWGRYSARAIFIPRVGEGYVAYSDNN